MYEKITLPNGVRIIYEYIPYVRSVTAGIWVGTGSRYESHLENGASHFIEHMVFKGTETRSASDIAEIMDGIGGQINAFTTKECTCFYGRVLDSHLKQLTNILCDMFFNSKFDNKDIKNELGVICEEIDMYEDSPEDLVVEQLLTGVYNPPLSYPILGTKDTISSFNGEALKTYKNDHYIPSNIVIAISGSFEKSDIAYWKEQFSSMPPKQSHKITPAAYTPAFLAKDKQIEQNHLFLAFPGPNLLDKDRYTMQILSNILGGGMSSRLFQSVREKYGLCYSIYTFGTSYIDSGIFGVYTALSGNMEEKALGLIIDEIKRFKQCGISKDELSRTREQLKSNLLMSLESTSSRMSKLGKNELYLGRVPEPDEIIAEYDCITAESIANLSEKYLNFKNLSFSAVGKVKNAERYKDYINSII